MLIGEEWIIDAYGCPAARLADLALLRRLCQRVVVELRLLVVGQPQWHAFPAPGGVTGIYLLGESHLACHTFPEHGQATFNLYCCRPREAWPWNERLTEALGASRVHVRSLARGAAADARPAAIHAAQISAHAAPASSDAAPLTEGT